MSPARPVSPEMLDFLRAHSVPWDDLEAQGLKSEARSLGFNKSSWTRQLADGPGQEVSISFPGDDIKVWLGFMKLDDKFPSKHALRQVSPGSR